MKTSILPLAILAFVISMISCQKEVSTGTDPIIIEPIPQPSHDSLRLKAYIVLDTSIGSPIDTITKTFYRYDDHKRLAGSVEYDVAFGASTLSYEYFYNGNDSLPFKSNQVSTQPGRANQYSVEYYFYDNRGRCTLDSIRYPAGVFDSEESYELLRYHYNGTTVNYVHKTYVVSMGEDSGFAVNTAVLTNNLVTSAFENSMFADRTMQATITYDNKINPFRRMNFNSSIVDKNLYPQFNFQTSNATEAIHEFTGPSDHHTEHFTFKYTYNNLNYPTSVAIGSIPDNLVTNKGLFFYY